MEYILSKPEILEEIIFEKRLDVKDPVYMYMFSGNNNCTQTAIINLLSYYNLVESNLTTVYKKLLKIQNKEYDDMTTDYKEIPKILKAYLGKKAIVNKFLFTRNNFFDYKINIDREDVVLAHLSDKANNFGHSVVIIGYAITKSNKYLIALTGINNKDKVYIPLDNRLDGIKGYTIYTKK